MQDLVTDAVKCSVCTRVYADSRGHPSLPPNTIAWRLTRASHHCLSAQRQTGDKHQVSGGHCWYTSGHWPQMSPWGMCGPMPRDWNYRSGRLHHTWLRTVESDSAPLNIGLATAYRLAQNRQVWSTLIKMATSSTMMMMLNLISISPHWQRQELIICLSGGGNKLSHSWQLLTWPGSFCLFQPEWGTSFLYHTVTYRIDVFSLILYSIGHLPEMLYPATTNFFPAYSALLQHYIIVL